MREFHPSSARDPRQFALEALYLSQLGRGEEARARLEPHLRGARSDPSLLLLMANSHRACAGAPDDTATLGFINTVFRRHGLQEIRKHTPQHPLSLDNLSGKNPDASSGLQAQVTVIVPAFNAETTLPTALRGLTEQSHGNLEILVVDDASQDGTADVAADLARTDPRVRLIRQQENRGGYAARNKALSQARGEFVTVHDADDWSHPDKIAFQLRHLMRTRAPSNFTAWVRTRPDLVFVGAARVLPNLMGLNDSSTLFRRDLFERLGTWDDARIAADKELIWRFEQLEGRPPESFRRRLLLQDCPLSFGRLAPSSLTRTGATHVLSIYHGIRREYREAAKFWHSELDTSAISARGFHESRPFFPIPPVIRPEKEPSPRLDVMFVGDFNFLGGTQKSACHMAAAARTAGLSTALLQYRRYDQDVTTPLNPDIRLFAKEKNIRIVAPGERVEVDTVVVTYPPVLAEIMDRFPRIAHKDLIVVVNQMAERNLEKTDIAYDPVQLRAHLHALFGSEGRWAPISRRVQHLMAQDDRYPAPLSEIWTPLIDTDLWSTRGARWRGQGRKRPLLGRHGRDHTLKWPGDMDALRNAYCADRSCDVRFLGGAYHARARLKRWPENWKDMPFGSQDVREFLYNLDVFLHYPDPSYIEEFGRAPMEAMAAGVPVLLPPEFEPTFGPAALYCPPEGVWPLVEQLWQDQSFWQTRVAAGRAFVTKNCSYAAFPDRLNRPAAP